MDVFLGGSKSGGSVADAMTITDERRESGKEE
jgi:hypothetical protein